MKTAPIEPALIEFGADADDPPRSLRFDDLYRPRVGAAAQARDVFLRGNGLPERWAGRERFVVLETGFGLGHNFIATWRAWRAWQAARDAAGDSGHDARLHYVAIEGHPPRRADLARAHAGSSDPALVDALLSAWPPLVPSLHAIEFDGGRVQLLLALGDVATLLPALRLQADAIFLDGFAPDRNPAMWQPRVLKALGRHAAAGATLATWSVARELRSGLQAAGFGVTTGPATGDKRECTMARWAPRFIARPLPDAAPRTVARRAASPSPDAVVLGAGIAGVAAARALAREGLQVLVLDRQPRPAMEATGNPAGLFHGTVNADDGIYARLFRAAALVAAGDYAEATAGHAAGLIRVETTRDLPAMQALLQRQGLPADLVEAVGAVRASELAGVRLSSPAWFWPGGGWLDAAAWVTRQLDAPGLQFQGGADVARLQREDGVWSLHGARGDRLATAPIVVLAAAGSSGALVQGLGHAPWPLRHSRGQVTQWAGTHPLLRPLAGDGYALPLPGGLLCGATRADEAPGDPALRPEDHRENLQRLLNLSGLAPPEGRPLQGRTAWRLHSDDRLPIAGAMPLVQLPEGGRRDQARLLPREAGLFVLTALGARGLTLAPLLGRLLAAQATGAPWPLEQDLADAVDPARWRVRAARRGLDGAGDIGDGPAASAR